MPRARGTGTPTALKLLQGVKSDRINHDEPVPEDGVPECPSTDEAVREVWDYTVRQLRTMRTLTMADRDMLHAYCEQVVVARKAGEVIAERGLTLRAGQSVMKNPALAIQRDAINAMKTIARDFGLTPSARTAIKVADQRPKQTEAGAARLLSG